MKKIICLLLCMCIVFSFAACGKQEKGPETALVLLETVWEKYGEEEKFPAGGGDWNEENQKMDAPGKYGVQDAEALEATFAIDDDNAVLLSDGASLQHMMNANTFTAGAFLLKDSGKINEYAAELKEDLAERQWICGTPDKYVIAKVGGYVVSVFGNKDLVDNFVAKLKTSFNYTDVLYDEMVA